MAKVDSVHLMGGSMKESGKWVKKMVKVYGTFPMEKYDIKEAIKMKCGKVTGLLMNKVGLKIMRGGGKMGKDMEQVLIIMKMEIQLIKGSGKMGSGMAKEQPINKMVLFNTRANFVIISNLWNLGSGEDDNDLKCILTL